MQLATYSMDGPSSLKHWEILVPIEPAKNEEFKNHYPQSLREDERGWDMFFVGLELYLNAYWLIKPHVLNSPFRQGSNLTYVPRGSIKIHRRSCKKSKTSQVS
jgi:hypothetical protein